MVFPWPIVDHSFVGHITTSSMEHNVLLGLQTVGLRRSYKAHGSLPSILWKGTHGPGRGVTPWSLWQSQVWNTSLRPPKPAVSPMHHHPPQVYTKICLQIETVFGGPINLGNAALNKSGSRCFCTRGTAHHFFIMFSMFVCLSVCFLNL